MNVFLYGQNFGIPYFPRHIFGCIFFQGRIVEILFSLKGLLDLLKIFHLIFRHPNLHADVSWDVLSKQLLMNYDPKTHNISQLHEVTSALKVMVMVMVAMDVVEYEPKTYNTSQSHEVIYKLYNILLLL